jgi:[acyl-carrier-protein] S-malonyltransferase
VSCANFNAPGQIVIAGAARAVSRVSERLREKPKDENGTPTRSSSIPLRVSAPFHCALMAPAAEVVRAELDGIELHPLAFPVIANVDAQPNLDASRVKDLLVRQVASAVRWEQAVRFMQAEGVTHALEIGPGKVLTGLCKRIAKEIRVLSVNDIASLDALGRFFEPVSEAGTTT